MARRQPQLADSADGHGERLRRVLRRTDEIFRDSPLARDSHASTMGTQIDFIHVGDNSFRVYRPIPDRVQLCHLAMLLRVFVLQKEQVYYKHVSNSLQWFAKSGIDRKMSDQLVAMWQHVSTSHRMTILKEGVTATDIEIADRVLYSRVAHADDASDLLDHIDEETQWWSLTALVGDWLALAAHQQVLIQRVRPDLCPELARWSGSPTTIFTRIGADVTHVPDDWSIEEATPKSGGHLG